MKLDWVVHACVESQLLGRLRQEDHKSGPFLATESQNKKKNEGLCLPTVCQGLNSILKTEVRYKHYLALKLTFINNIGILFKF